MSNVSYTRLMTLLVLFVLLCQSLTADEPGSGHWKHRELRRFKAIEANQGVAVDRDFFYAIDNRSVGKYRKADGQRVARWEEAKDGPLKHLNAGIVLDGKLYAAHSNYPDRPEKSSVEIWDVTTLTHSARHEFTQPPGSLTWALPRETEWLACFAHYRSSSDPARSVVVRFDKQWQSKQSWRFPPRLVERFAGYSASGGAVGPQGFLFVTGHDARELYVLSLPSHGDELEWHATIPISAAGQAFAWDPTDGAVLYSIERKTREVIVSRVTSE